MAKVATAFDSYDAIGLREDLSDFISNISPLETPMWSRFGTSKATSRLHDWQTDALAAAADNAYSEGEAFTAVARTATTRHSNYTQVQIKMFSITDTQNIVDKAGRSSESAYQMTKAAFIRGRSKLCELRETPNVKPRAKRKSGSLRKQSQIVTARL